MYNTFIGKIKNLLSLAVYQRAFDVPLDPIYNLYGKPEGTRVKDMDYLDLLMGFFFIFVLNDPLIRYSIQSFISSIKTKVN